MKKVIIDSRVRHGKPVIEGTRVTIEDALGMLESGMTYEEIYDEYGLTKEDIIVAIRYVASLVRGEEIRKIAKK